MDLERALQAEVTSDAVLRAHLAHGERTLWGGKPGVGVLRPEASTFRLQVLAAAIAVVLCVLVFTAFRNPSPVTRVLGILLPLAPLYKLIGAPFVDARERRETTYALTNRRILIVRGGLWGRKVQSLPLKEIAGVHVTGSTGGRGTIRLGLDRERRPQGELRLIERPEEVSDLIRQAQIAARFPETPGSSATQVSPAL